MLKSSFATHVEWTATVHTYVCVNLAQVQLGHTSWTRSREGLPQTLLSTRSFAIFCALLILLHCAPRTCQKQPLPRVRWRIFPCWKSFFWVPLFVLSVPSFLSSPPYFFFVSLFVLFVRPKEIIRFLTQTGWAVYYPKENKASYITSVNGPLFFCHQTSCAPHIFILVQQKLI